MKIGISTAVSFLITVMLYLALSLPKINQPVTDDEIYEIRNAESILAGKPIHLYVPPIYDYVLACTVRYLGNKPWAFRIPGILSSIVSIGIVMLISFLVFPRKKLRNATVAGLLLATNPVFVQGSLLIHIDNTILVPAILLWLYFLLYYLESYNRLSLVLSGLLFAVALLIKFSTPIFILFAITPFFFMKNNRHLLSVYVFVFFLSFCTFLVAWATIASVMNLSFWKPLIFAGNRLTFNMAAVVLNVWTMWVWFTPYVLLLFALLLPVVVSAVVSGTDRTSVLPLASAGVLVYLFISSINHGFPKYLTPGLPLLVISNIYYLKDKTEFMARVPVLALISIITVSAWFLLSRYDTIYAFRFSLREVLITDQDTWAIARILLVQAVVWFFPLLAYFIIHCTLRGRTRITVPEFLLIVIFSHGLTLGVIQNMSSYQTNYSYGETGTMDLNRFLADNAGQDQKILATKDILYRLGRFDQYIEPDFWIDTRGFLSLLEYPSTHFLVTSISSQSITFYKRVLHDEAVQSCLMTYFRRRQIGTYTVYQRINSDSSRSR